MVISFFAILPLKPELVVAIQFVRINNVLLFQDDFLLNFPNCFQKFLEYNVEVSMPEYFEIPEKIYIPVLASSRVNNLCAGKGGDCSAKDTGKKASNH